MRETVEFRIPEENARRFLRSNEGKRLGSSVRAFEVATDDPRYQRIGQLNKDLRQKRSFFFLGWTIKRYYTAQELNSAQLFRLKIAATFEPAGEECGTLYDESIACQYCGAGRRQISDLILDLRKAPKGKDIARTIADEWIISQKLAQSLVDAQMKGFELRPVRHKAHYQADPIDLSTLPSGRQLLERAKFAGHPYPSWLFDIWLNRPEQMALYDQALQEYVESRQTIEARQPAKPYPPWYQFISTSRPAKIRAPTQFGVHPFDEDHEGQYQCPLGHVRGLNLLSELWVTASSWEGSDITKTEEMAGWRQGVLRPAPLLLISPRLRRLLQAENIKGYQIEIAHFA